MAPLRRAAVLGISALMSFGALAGLSVAPASAQISHPSVALSDRYGCADHSWCQWNMTYFSGLKWTWHYNNVPHNKWFYIGDSANDGAASIDNNRAYHTEVAKNAPADAQWACDAGKVSNLNNYMWPNTTPAVYSISSLFFKTNNSDICCETLP